MSKEVVKNESVTDVVLNSDGFKDGACTLTTFDTETFADKVAAFMAIDSADNARENKLVGQPFILTNYAIFDAEFVDEESGEIQRTDRVILQEKQGGTMYMFSSPLARSIRVIDATFGNPSTWDMDLEVRIVEGLTAKKHTFYRLEVLGQVEK